LAITAASRIRRDSAAIIVIVGCTRGYHDRRCRLFVPLSSADSAFHVSRSSAADKPCSAGGRGQRAGSGSSLLDMGQEGELVASPPGQVSVLGAEAGTGSCKSRYTRQRGVPLDSVSHRSARPELRRMGIVEAEVVNRTKSLPPLALRVYDAATGAPTHHQPRASPKPGESGCDQNILGTPTGHSLHALNYPCCVNLPPSH